MTQLTMDPGGSISLPRNLQERYGFSRDTPIRVVESRSGVLLVPLTRGSMGPELARELADWQTLGTAAWDAFPYDDEEEGA
jgi:hypothetical protein